MAVSTKYYRVGLILSAELDITDYVLPVGNQKYNVCFYSSTLNQEKYCDLVITDKEPNELSTISIQQKNCHETTLVINHIPNPLLERAYESIFTEVVSLKYKTIKKLTNESITKLINAELVKCLVKDNRIEPIVLLYNKYTRGDLLNRILTLKWLLVPFIIIVLYLIGRCISSKLGSSFSFLCWLDKYKYKLDCKNDNDILGELKLLALIYSFFNLTFYYHYSLSIFGNINNDVFLFNTSRRLFHKVLQYITPLILFVFALIIFKAFFVFMYSFRIAEDYSLIKIGTILDSRLSYLKDYYLIYYFFALDLCLWLMTKNFFKTISAIQNSFSSNRQINLIKDAKKSFGISIVWDIIIWFVTVVFFRLLIIDQQSTLAVQLVFLQSAYLYINITTIFYDFKFK